MSLEDVVKRMLEKGDVEKIRNTMQIHEDVFKHQVKELHRLYRIQKKSMDELRMKIDHFQYQSLWKDPSLRERSGSCSGNNVKISRGFDLERPVEDDISTRKSVINEDQVGLSTRYARKSKTIRIDDGYDEDTEMELTLSIGSSLSKKRSKSALPLKNKSSLKEINFSSSFKLEREKESSGPTTPMSSSTRKDRIGSSKA